MTYDFHARMTRFATDGPRGPRGRGGGGWNDDGGGPHESDRQLAAIFGAALHYSLASDRDYDAMQGLSYAAQLLDERIKEVFTITSLLAPQLRAHAQLLLRLDPKDRLDALEICRAHRSQSLDHS